MKEVTLNGFNYYVDPVNRILYYDRDKKSGIPLSFCTKNEREQIETQLRFPRVKQKF